MNALLLSFTCLLILLTSSTTATSSTSHPLSEATTSSPTNHVDKKDERAALTSLDSNHKNKESSSSSLLYTTTTTSTASSSQSSFTSTTIVPPTSTQSVAIPLSSPKTSCPFITRTSSGSSSNSISSSNSPASSEKTTESKVVSHADDSSTEQSKQEQQLQQLELEHVREGRSMTGAKVGHEREETTSTSTTESSTVFRTRIPEDSKSHTPSSLVPILHGNYIIEIPRPRAMRFLLNQELEDEADLDGEVISSDSSATVHHHNFFSQQQFWNISVDMTPCQEQSRHICSCSIVSSVHVSTVYLTCILCVIFCDRLEIPFYPPV